MKLIDLVETEKYKNIVLLGPGGAGKTSQMIALFKSIIESKTAIPIFINLSAFDDRENFILEKFLSDYTNYAYKQGDSLKVLVKNFFEKQTNKKFIFLFDAINETSSTCLEYLYNDIIFLAMIKNVRVVLSCRYEMIPGGDLFSTFNVLPLPNEKLCDNIPNYEMMSKEMRTILGLPMYYKIYLDLNLEEKTTISRETLIEKYFEFILRKMGEVETRTYLYIKYRNIVKKILFQFLPEYFFHICYEKINYMLINDDIDLRFEEYKQQHGIVLNKACTELLLELGIFDEFEDTGAAQQWRIKNEVYFDYFIDKAFINRLSILEGSFINRNKIYIDLYSIVSFYDGKGDCEKAYKYGKTVIDELKKEKISPDNDLMLTIAHGLTACGYAVLHYTKRETRHIELAFESFKRASQILSSNSNKLNEEQQDRYIRIKTTLTGNLGAYYYKNEDYLTAKEYHYNSLKEREQMLKTDKDKDYWLFRIAIAYKNIGSDWFQLAQKSSSEKGMFKLAFVYHYKAYKIYKNLARSMNKDLIVSINRLVGCVIPFIETGEIISPIAEVYGSTPEEVVGKVLLDIYEILNYFTRHIIIYTEVEDCIMKTKNIIEIIKRKRLKNKSIELFYKKLMGLNYTDGFMTEKKNMLIEEVLFNE